MKSIHEGAHLYGWSPSAYEFAENRISNEELQQFFPELALDRQLLRVHLAEEFPPHAVVAALGNVKKEAMSEWARAWGFDRVPAAGSFFYPDYSSD